MTTFTLEKHDDLAIVTMDMQDVAQNVLNQKMQPEFEAILDKIANDDRLNALIFRSGKKDCFLAGADISMFQTIDSAEQASQASGLLHALFQRIADLNMTTVCAIDGICLGGGLELALVFDYRVASDSPATRIGVPEVQLGLLPGGGGTTRLPRLIDLPVALDMILTGKQLDGKRAKAAGLVDALVAPQALMDVARVFSQKGKPARDKSIKQKLLSTTLARKLIISQARKSALKATKGHYPAPLKILDVIERSLGADLPQALLNEAQGFGDLLVTPESQQLVNIFFAVTDLKKDTGVDSDAQSRNLHNIGVLGAGLMGAGIAYVTIDKAKIATRLKDVSVAGLAKGVAYVGKIVDKKLARRRIKAHQRQATMARLTGAVDYTGFANSDVVIEAVFESLELKQQMVADIEALNADKETVFATNTSAIPIDEIAAKAQHPERVVGMHYFSPVEKMPLLEVVKGSQTADWAIATAVQLGKRQGKTVIVVNDGPGFYTTRVLVPYNMEAVRVVLEGVAIEKVDQALEQFGMPVGPIKLMDEVGIDVGAHIVDTLNAAFGKRIPLIEGMEKMLNDDRKGRKNGRGFYDYSDKSKGKEVDQSVYTLMEISNAGEKSYPAEQIAERIILSMLNEAAFCLHQGILRNARDGDIGAIFGLGFPPFLGGPFRYMDTLGIDTVIAKLKELELQHGARFKPAPNLTRLANNKKTRTFYPN